MDQKAARDIANLSIFVLTSVNPLDTQPYLSAF